MPSNIEINVDAMSAREALKELKGLNAQALLMPAAQHIRDNEINNPPKKKAGAFTRLATVGQKRAYWAGVRSGRINHGTSGYIRSGKTTGAWKIKRVTGALEIQNAAPGAKWVYGEGSQQPFHGVKGSGFLRTDQASVKYGNKVRELVDKEIGRRLKSL